MPFLRWAFHMVRRLHYRNVQFLASNQSMKKRKKHDLDREWIIWSPRFIDRIERKISIEERVSDLEFAVDLGEADHGGILESSIGLPPCPHPPCPDLQSSLFPPCLSPEGGLRDRVDVPRSQNRDSLYQPPLSGLPFFLHPSSKLAVGFYNERVDIHPSPFLYLCSGLSPPLLRRVLHIFAKMG